MLVQGDQTGDETLLEHAREYIRRKYKKPGNVFMGLVHRLDRPVSGLVVLARTSKGLERMNDLFRKREITKKYWAMTEQAPGMLEGRLTHWLIKDRSRNLVKVTRKPGKGAVKAELDYRTISHIDRFYLLEIDLLTGRPHQIRAQLSAAGCPITGDVKYGYSKANPDASVCLHARELRFIHPVRKENLVLIASPPENQLWNHFINLA